MFNVSMKPAGSNQVFRQLINPVPRETIMYDINKRNQDTGFRDVR